MAEEALDDDCTALTIAELVEDTEGDTLDAPTGLMLIAAVVELWEIVASARNISPLPAGCVPG